MGWETPDESNPWFRAVHWHGFVSNALRKLVTAGLRVATKRAIAGIATLAV